MESNGLVNVGVGTGGIGADVAFAGVGAYASHPPLHKAGDTVEGRCDLRLARIESNKILRGQLWIAAMFQMIGLVPIILALMIVF